MLNSNVETLYVFMISRFQLIRSRTVILNQLLPGCWFSMSSQSSFSPEFLLHIYHSSVHCILLPYLVCSFYYVSRYSRKKIKNGLLSFLFWHFFTSVTFWASWRNFTLSFLKKKKKHFHGNFFDELSSFVPHPH